MRDRTGGHGAQVVSAVRTPRSVEAAGARLPFRYEPTARAPPVAPSPEQVVTLHG